MAFIGNAVRVPMPPSTSPRRTPWCAFAKDLASYYFTKITDRWLRLTYRDRSPLACGAGVWLTANVSSRHVGSAWANPALDGLYLPKDQAGRRREKSTSEVPSKVGSGGDLGEPHFFRTAGWHYRIDKAVKRTRFRRIAA